VKQLQPCTSEDEVSDKFLTPSTRALSVESVYDSDSLTALTVARTLRLETLESFLERRMPRSADQMAFNNGAHNVANLMNITDSTGNPLMLSRTPRSIDEGLGEFFVDGRTSVFTDADLAQVSSLLQNSNHTSYSRAPRLYTVLRIINHLELLTNS
jgi:hypothetical protein